MFFDVLGTVIERFAWLCHTYCLMDNQHHLLIETPIANLSRGMRSLNGVYTQRFNRRHSRVGHVFQGRYKAVVVERDSHLLELSRYIVRNPVGAEMVSAAGDYSWSSYGAMTGKSRRPDWFRGDWIVGRFGGATDDALAGYRRFVEADAEDADGGPRPRARGNVLGSDGFRAQVRVHVEPHDEAAKAECDFSCLSLKEVRGRYPQRPEWMARAHRDQGHTMRAIAREAGLHYSSVSKIIKAWEGKNSTFKT